MNCKDGDCPLSNCDLDALITQAARQAGVEGGKQGVSEAFKYLGLDIHDPKSIQTWHANTAWTYRTRKIAEKIGTIAIIGLVSASAGVAFVYGGLFKKIGGP